MSIPQALRYTKEHEWVAIEGNQVTVGITHFAQEELGDIVFVELPEVGDTVTVNESFGNVESVKTVSELYSPVSGTIVKVNSELTENPERVNESPYEDAWMIVIELSEPSQLDGLLTAEQYEASLTN